jgi:hypothetical protein
MSRRIEEEHESGSSTPARGHRRAGVLWAALAAVLTTAAPMAALAQTPDADDAAPGDVHEETAKPAPTKASKPADSRKSKKSKRREHADQEHADKGHADKGHADKEHADKEHAGKSHAGKSKAHDDKSKAHDGASRGKSKSKKTASRAGKKKSTKKAEGKTSAGAASKAPQKPCFGPTITVDRGGLETESFPLVDCLGAPTTQALAHLSILARPWAIARPDLSKAKPKARSGKDTRAPEARSDEIAAGVRQLDPGLVTRVAAISAKFPGKGISLVSGYRPQSRGSLHQTARAIDLRVSGVDNADLAAFCRTLPDTGCGFYPNSSFVHVDVRAPGTGMVTWIDASGPGEAPRYVSAWPPPQAAENAGSPDASPPADAAHEHERTDTKDDAADLYEVDPGASSLPDESARAAPRLLGPTLHPALDKTP